MLDLPIATSRLRIRHLVPTDIEPFVEFMTDPEATRYLAFDDDQRNAAGAKAMVEATIASYDSDEPIHALAVAESETDDYVGSVGFHDSEDEPGVVEIFYTTNPRFQGRGFASEAASALIEALLRLPTVAEVRAYVAEANVASSRTAPQRRAHRPRAGNASAARPAGTPIHRARRQALTIEPSTVP